MDLNRFVYTLNVTNRNSLNDEVLMVDDDGDVREWQIVHDIFYNKH